MAPLVLGASRLEPSGPTPPPRRGNRGWGVERDFAFRVAGGSDLRALLAFLRPWDQGSLRRGAGHSTCDRVAKIRCRPDAGRAPPGAWHQGSSFEQVRAGRRRGCRGRHVPDEGLYRLNEAGRRPGRRRRQHVSKRRGGLRCRRGRDHRGGRCHERRRGRRRWRRRWRSDRRGDRGHLSSGRPMTLCPRRPTGGARSRVAALGERGSPQAVTGELPRRGRAKKTPGPEPALGRGARAPPRLGNRGEGLGRFARLTGSARSRLSGPETRDRFGVASHQVRLLKAAASAAAGRVPTALLGPLCGMLPPVLAADLAEDAFADSGDADRGVQESFVAVLFVRRRRRELRDGGQGDTTGRWMRATIGCPGCPRSKHSSSSRDDLVAA